MRHSNISPTMAFAALAGMCFLASACSSFTETGNDDVNHVGAVGNGSVYTSADHDSDMAGINSYLDGNYAAARDTFASQVANDPDNLYPQFNLADAHNAMGNRAEAIALYRQVAYRGANVSPGYIYEPHDSNTTFRDAACQHLRQLNTEDPSCPQFQQTAAVAPAPPPPAAVKTYIVFFDFDKSDLTPEAQTVIMQAVETARQDTAVRVKISGNTDTVGSDAYNQALSERRAGSVKDEMVHDGMTADDISTVGNSFHDPLVPTGPGVREPQNRRAVIDLGGYAGG